VEEDPALTRHIHSLGLETVEEYVAWCILHGFSRRTAKTGQQRSREHSFATRATAQARLAQKKHELRSPEKIIQAILHGQLAEAEVTQPYLQAICRAARSLDSCPTSRQAYLDLLTHAGRCTDLLAAHPVVPQYGRQEGNTFIGGLLGLARHASGWLRPLAEWRPRTHNAGRQFASLARHLFARWPVPSFMDSVWFRGVGEEALRQQEWFLHIGRGENIRTADLPLPYTKKMAHHFLEAPADFTALAGLRWGQIHGLGGNDRLVRAILGTRLGSHFEHDDFWITVLRFFIANPMLDVSHLGPIIDYIHQQRFVWAEVTVSPGVVERQAPPQPGFTMKGRTPASLLRQVEGWHRSLARDQQDQADWPHSGIDWFEFIEGSEHGGNRKIWTISELLSTRALVAEGRAMKHCVATYARSCARGECSIWTLELATAEGRARVLTIEVRNAARLIVQVRGKCNTLPGEKHRVILRRWAGLAGLRLGSYV
jgi:hypothetical protein